MSREAPLSEQEVLRRFPILTEYALRKARKAGTIAWVPGPWRSPHYYPAAVEDYIRRLETPCLAQEQSPCSNSPDNGLPPCIYCQEPSPNLLANTPDQIPRLEITKTVIT